MIKVFFFKISLFTYFLYVYVLAVVGLVAACRFSVVAENRGYFSLWCSGFSLWWLLLL